MSSTKTLWLGGSVLVLAGTLAGVGCSNTVVELTDFVRGPAPLRMPSPAAQGCDCYEDSLTGAQVFEMYCNQCHNAPSLAERPFSNWRNVAAHMRDRANLTGKEYAKLVAWMRRWHDVPGPHPPVEPGPKKVTFSQPIGELRGEAEKAGKGADGKTETLPPPKPAPQP
jgi:hypothetical protein